MSDLVPAKMTESGIIVPSLGASTELVIGAFVIALAVVCAYYVTRRK